MNNPPTATVVPEHRINESLNQNRLECVRLHSYSKEYDYVPEYELFVRVKIVRVERSQSLVQTLVIQLPLLLLLLLLLLCGLKTR